jgi:coenzyme Q-binding protein COQ10
MPQFSTKRRVQHDAGEMFDLVADVESYPQFVPLCRSLRVIRRVPEPEGIEIVVAEMTIAYKLLRERFTSRVTLDRPNLQILVEYLDGPFSHMQNRWSFNPSGEHACEIEFFIDYEFRSRTLGMLMGAMFDAAFRRFSAAFEKRADQVYGRKRRVGESVGRISEA